MNKRALVVLLCLLFPLTLNAEPPPANSKNIMATVLNFTRVKILESNNISLRPGSVYDNTTYFESLLDIPKPGFNYEFMDSGLGAAEPLYPMYQKGHQGSYAQLIPAAVSPTYRHIDHYSSLTTPEGCQVDSIYLLRGIGEYPKDVLVQERKDGFTQVVTRLEYYTRLRSNAQCGRHRANDPDSKFNPVKFMKKYHKAMSLADFPQADLARFEAKFSVIYHMIEQMKPNHAKFDLNSLTKNSLWYYQNGHSFDYDVNTVRTQPGLQSFNLPRHMIVPATSTTQANFPLESLLSSDDFQKVMNFLNGKPTPDFDPNLEPGHDTLNLSDVTTKNIYSSGLYMENIQNVAADVSNPKNFKMVAMTIKPYELQDDVSWNGLQVIPQIRFVFQMMDPRDPTKAFEQLYFHLKWDVVDRTADQATRNKQHQYFLSRVDQLTQAREANAPDFEDLLAQFVHEFTSVRPIETVAFSSSLTGIWVFGTLTRNNNVARALAPLRIVRDGIDVGYYSTVYDNDIFRAEIASSTGARKTELQQHMDSLTMGYYRDPRREDVHAIAFNTVTCAQCHQTSARDGVHTTFNDGLDRRQTDPMNATEYFFREADDQLLMGQKFWVQKGD